MPRLRFLLPLLTVALFLSASAGADTKIHGIVIPTVEHDAGPELLICSSTGNWWNNGANLPGSYGVAVCRRPQDTGVRHLNLIIPHKVMEALTLIEQSVTFDHNSITLSEDALAAIRVVTAWMAEVPEARLVIAGHTDATGTEGYNEILSENRARSVASLLSTRGVDIGRLDVEWFGESELLVNTSKRDRSNRRVVITPSIE
jgi:outer membrane protein OmpA-like peptidoglycan-associated protein